MFDKNFNIIVGNNSTWKSSALHAISYDLKSQLNKKIIFLGSLSENKTHFMNERYYLHRYFSYDDENNVKMFKVIEELCLKNQIDFLFIDDIDRFSATNAKKYISFLNKIPVRKIATCTDTSSIPLHEFSEEITDSENYFLHIKYNNGHSYVTINDVKADDFIKSFIRDEKLKTILE
jgi:hypothetical protein